MIKGVGRDANPIDGDHIVIEIGVRNGKVTYVDPKGIIAGVTTVVGDVAKAAWFLTGAEARPHGDTFGGCDTARRAASVLYRLAIGRTIDEGLAISVGDVIVKMGGAPSENERCVLTVLGALRSALIDAHVATLAEATVEAKRLRVK